MIYFYLQRFFSCKSILTLPELFKNSSLAENCLKKLRQLGQLFKKTSVYLQTISRADENKNKTTFFQRKCLG